MAGRPESNTTPWARCPCRKTRSTARRPRARWRTSRSARMRLQRPFIRALGMIKAAAAQGQRLNRLIERGGDRRLRGRRGTMTTVRCRHFSDRQRHLHQHERQRGDRTRSAGAHPNDDVNRGQSSNDVIPVRHAHCGRGSRNARACCRRCGELFEHSARKGARVPRRDQDRPDASAGCGAHAPGAGVQRLCASGGGCAAADRSRADRDLRTAAGRHGGGHRTERAAGFRARRPSPRSRGAPGLPFAEAPNHFEAQAAKDAVVFLERRAARRTPSR